jgi:hypothetical protein
MPGHTKAMKAAASCDKLGGAAHTLRSRDGRMGKPGGGQPPSPVARRERTQGTETSQYLEEEKSTEMPQVAASERGAAQTSLLVGLGL